jgi:hypothetical protein
MTNTTRNDGAENGRRLATITRLAGWGAVAGLLLLPAIAMQFTDEVQWTAEDFVFAGGILGGAGVVVELIAWKSGSMAYRAGACLALAAVVLLVWVNGAVGIIGNEDEAANLLYLGVIAVAFIGAVIARFQPGGMMRAMAATAVAQIGVAVTALVLGWGATSANWPKDIIGATFVFALIWIGSAALFREAARRSPAAD